MLTFAARFETKELLKQPQKQNRKKVAKKCGS